MRCLVLMSLALMTATSLRAATLTVDDDGPADFNNIRAAIQAAKSGDMILLADGVYRGPDNRDLQFEGKPLVLAARNGPEHCIIDCEHKDRGFYLYGAHTAGTVIEGITVLNGWAWLGAGICCDDRTSVTIRGCVIRDNTAPEGGGLYCGNQASATVIDCVIYANTSEGMGGGIRNSYGNLTLIGCILGHNLATSGGGLHSSGVPPQIIDSTFVQNIARADGGGAYCERGPQPMLNCIFLGNRAEQAGGALQLGAFDSEETTIANCTFGDNTAVNGGGLHCNTGTSIRLVNSILANHTGHAIHVNWGNSPIVQDCLFHDNQPGDCRDSGGTVTGPDRINVLRVGNDGNGTGDPCFAIPGDSRLTLASAGVERGTNEPGTELPATDIDGNPRVIDGNGDAMAVVDIGACEYDPQAPSIAVSTCFVEFVRELGGPEPEAVTLTVGHGGGGESNWRIDCDCPWLHIEPASGITTDVPSQVTLTADADDLPRGIHQTLLTIRDPAAMNSPRRVLVTLRIQGTLAVPGQYSSIQDAIDAAMKNELVEVGPGAYPEALTLHRPIRLVGTGRPTLVVPTAACGIQVEAGGCTVDGFEICGGSVGISVSSSNNLIANNTILGSGTGLSVGDVSNTLLNNEIANCVERGLSIFSSGNTCRGNQMHDNPCNFSPPSQGSIDFTNDIDGTNTVDGKAIYYLVGQSDITIGADSNAGCVVAIHCRGIQIRGLTLDHNAYGILFVDTRDSLVEDCIAADNTISGVYLYASSRNTLTANTITGCAHGLWLSGSGNNVLRENRMTNNRYNFCGSAGYAPEHFRQDITPDNTVDGKPIYYLVWAREKVIDGSSNAGCVYAVECSGITIREVTLENNDAGVVLFKTTDSTIENVALLDNEYAGVVLNNCVNDVLCGNSIAGNLYGIAITASGYPQDVPQAVVIDRNIVSGNRIGIYSVSRQTTDVRNCYIAGNASSGIHYGGTGLRVVNCTLVGNGGDDTWSSHVGGISLDYHSGTTIVNSILCANTPRQISPEQGVQVTHSVVQGGYAGEGNLDTAPAITPDGHLTGGSPCIGAGRRTDCPAYDLDGERRDPNDPVDIGCDQFFDADHDSLPDWWELACFDDRTAARADDDPDGDGHDNVAEYELYSSDPTVPAATYYVDAKRPDDSNDGLSWNTAKRSIQAAIDAADNSDTVQVAPGLYSDEVNTRGRLILLTGVDAEDPETVAETVLGGTLTISEQESRGCVIAGLTISNPNATGLQCVGSSPAIRRCRITGNHSSDWHRGGGVTLIGAAPLITYCTIDGNRTYSQGAGIFSWLSRPILRNCIVAGNTLTSTGTAMCAEQSDVTIENCTIAHNDPASTWSPPQEAAIWCFQSTMRISNSILWNDTSAQVLGSESSITVTYSDVKGGVEDLQGVSETMGNISVDPQFVSPGRWDASVPYPWENAGNWIEGDYHLKSAGWRWVPSVSHGSHWIWDDLTSRCIDAGNPAMSVGEEPMETPNDPEQRWGRNIRIDMGAYGGTSEASLAPNGWAILTDINNDGRADWRDFARWAQAFQSRSRLDPANVTRDSRVDYADLSRIADQWLQTTDWLR